MNESSIQQVPMAAFEAEQARTSHIIYTLIVGWAVSVIVLGFALIAAISYEAEEISEVTTVEQSADNDGSTYFANGDLINGGKADSNQSNDN